MFISWPSAAIRLVSSGRCGQRGRTRGHARDGMSECNANQALCRATASPVLIASPSTGFATQNGLLTSPLASSPAGTIGVRWISMLLPHRPRIATPPQKGEEGCS